MWRMTTQKDGASAPGLRRVPGLKQYQTAWTWLHKLRSAMVRPGRDLLTGRIEVDECCPGGLEEGLRGRLTESKALVIVAAQENGRGIGRIRLRLIPDASSESPHPFILESVAPGSVICTDGWRGYSGIETQGYVHQITVLKGKKQPASELLPRVHLVISLLKRWLMGTYQGAVSHKHLTYYLDEFTFRFNRRKSASRARSFYRLVRQAAAVEPSTCDDIVGKIRARLKTANPQAPAATGVKHIPSLPDLGLKTASAAEDLRRRGFPGEQPGCLDVSPSCFSGSLGLRFCGLLNGRLRRTA